MDALEILRGLLVETRREPEEQSEPERWDPADSDSMVDWLEQEVISQQGDRLRIRGVPRLEEMVRWFISQLQGRERIRSAILGPRGGGKTFLVAAIQMLAARWYGGSSTNLGGSKEQAARCYAHILRTIQAPAQPDGFSGDFGDHVLSSILSKTTLLSHSEIEVLAASSRSVRGAHPKGPSGLGMVVIDEAALVDDSIVDAAKKQIVTASPSAVIQTSTMGTDQKGAWWRLTQNPKNYGYHLFAYDVFDVAARCPYVCESTCPIPEHFANDYSIDLGGGRSQHVHKAYCGGKAHHTDGHIEVDEIAQQFLEGGDRLSFERELMGWGSGNVGKVYEGTLIERAISEDVWLDRGRDPDQHWRRFLLCEKAAGLDWGYSAPSQTAIAWGLRFRDKIVVYRWQFWSGERFSNIRAVVAEAVFRERVGTIRPDGANPSDNDEMQDLLSGQSKHLQELARAATDDVTRLHGDSMGGVRTFMGARVQEDDVGWDCLVEPVNFGREKDYGIGEVRRRLEHGTIIFAARFGGQPVQNHDRAMDYLRGYHYDDHGKPAKVMDHGPDALLCLVGTWAPRRMGGT